MPPVKALKSVVLPQLGVPAIAIVVGLIGTFFFGKWIVNRYGVFARWDEIVKISVACILPAPVLWLVNMPSMFNPDRFSIAGYALNPLAAIILGVIIEYLIYFIAYSILLFLFGVFDNNEKVKILRLLRIKKKE